MILTEHDFLLGKQVHNQRIFNNNQDLKSVQDEALLGTSGRTFQDQTNKLLRFCYQCVDVDGFWFE